MPAEFPDLSLQMTPPEAQSLSDLKIDAAGPGTVLRDIETWLEFLEAGEIPATPAGLPALKVLESLNAAMTQPRKIALQRPQLRSYPNLAGLYLLLRATGLVYLGLADRRQVLTLDPAVHASWRGLNHTEKYFTLMEAWLVRGNPHLIGERHYVPLCVGGHLNACLLLYSRLQQQAGPDGPAGNGAERLQRFYDAFPGYYNLALLELFGLLRIRSGEAPGEHRRIEYLEPVPAGRALLKLLARIYSDRDLMWRYDADSDLPSGELRRGLEPYFPEYRNTLYTQVPGFVDGLYFFRLVVPGYHFHARLAVPAACTLDELGEYILIVLDFDFDHPFRFTYSGRQGLEKSVQAPGNGEPVTTREVRVGDTGLRAGETMTCVYELGSGWRMDLHLERIDPPVRASARPALLGTHGRPPHPSPRWGDELELWRET